VKAVRDSVGALPGVSDVAVDLKAKTVTVEHDPVTATLEKIKIAIEDQGYDIVG
jgi:copper chaperone